MKLAQYLSVIDAGGPGSGRHPGFGQAPSPYSEKGPYFKPLPAKLENEIRHQNPYRAKLIGNLIDLAEKAEEDMKRADPYSAKQLAHQANSFRSQAKRLSDAWGLAKETT
jgi:hypothetical protein